MRIGIDASPIFGDRGGVGWHTYHLLRAMVESDDKIEFVCYIKPGQFQRPPAESWMSDRRLRWAPANRIMMRWRGKWDALDLYHGPNFRMRTQGRFGGVVTVHDLWLDRHPEYSPKLFGQRAAFQRTKRTVWRARKVITVSAFSAQEISALYGLPLDRIAVIPNGVSEDFRPVHDRQALEALRVRIGVRGRFILFVGGADPRKNHRVFLEAVARRKDRLAGWTFVLAGDRVHRFGDYLDTARSLGLEHQVTCPGRLGREDLRMLYSEAAIFVFPSHYEGFGMPVLEAMACGAPTITSNTSSLPEVAGDAAIQVNPADAEALGDAMVRLVEDEALRQTLRSLGFDRAKRFTWNQAAERTLAVYRELCA